MKRIYRKISLEKFKSRFPGIINSYKDNIYYNFSNETQITNYSMFPSDIQFTTENYGKELPEILKDTNGVVSYPTLVYWFNFLKSYNKLLIDESKCGVFKYKDLIEFSVKKNDDIDFYQNIQEYYNLIGGDYMLEWLKNNCFTNIKNPNITIEDKNTYYNDITFNAYINIPILLTNSIDDLGLMSVYDNEWEANNNYKSTNASGTVVTYNDDDWILTNPNTNKGYIYSKTYNEYYFGNYDALSSEEKEYCDESQIEGERSQWIRYYELNKESIPYNKSIEYSLKDNKIVFNPSIENMSDIFYLKKSEFSYYIINNVIYEAKKYNYVICNDESSIFYKTYFQVLNNENDYYIIINNKKNYLYYDEDLSEFYFKFNNVKSYLNHDDNNKLDNNKEFISLNNILYSVNSDNNIIINKFNGEIDIYHPFKKYCEINNNIYILDDNNKTIKYICEVNKNISTYILTEYKSILGDYFNYENYDNTVNGYTIHNDKIYICSSYYKYNFNKINGITESKLDTLLYLQNAFDDMGNKLNGRLQIINDSILEPKENYFLDLTIKVGNVSNLTYESENKIWGNIIESIHIYNNENQGFEINMDDNLNNVNIVNKIKEFYGDYVDNLNCDITYCIGALLTINGDKYSFYKDKYNNYFYGVRYIDKTKLIITSCLYYFDENTFLNMFYYDLSYEYINTVLSDYSNSKFSTKKSFFSVDADYSNTNLQQDKGYNTLPTYRNKYNIGISTSQSVEKDIKIDRGIAQFVVRHLNLIETKTLSALEKYGNGIFKIIKS